MQQSKIAKLWWAGLAGLGLIAGLPGVAAAGGFRIDIDLGGRPRPAPVVIEYNYNTYCVGFRAALYDADWRLRNAQIDQWHAADALDAARHHEGDVSVSVEERETLVADFGKRVADSDAALAAARAAAGRALDELADARARRDAYEHRAHEARKDLESSRILRDAVGIADAENRIRLNEAGAAAAAEDARIAERRAADLKAAEDAAFALNDMRVRFDEAQARLPRLREELALAHDEVYGDQQRLDAAVLAVAQALHDRDEALWMLHRDEIFAGRSTLEGCGFRIDFGVWGGRRPDDIEVIHAYYVHPVAYWVERPAEIQVRLVEADRVTDIGHIRDIQRKHEGARFAEVARVEATVPQERRAAYFERASAERQRFAAEKTERAAAIAEHRAPRIPESERAEARAIATQNRGEARASEIEARGNARAEDIKARGDARAKETEARGDARAEETKAHADVRAKETESRGDARAEETKAHADVRAKETESRGDARAEETKARADARAQETQSRESSRGSHPSTDSNSRSARDKNGNSASSNARDPHKKSKDEQAATDPNSR